jgi:hypothetical protein
MEIRIESKEKLELMAKTDNEKKDIVLKFQDMLNDKLSNLMEEIHGYVLDNVGHIDELRRKRLHKSIDKKKQEINEYCLEKGINFRVPEITNNKKEE